ncbi:MAG: DUF1232 domain-containing protein [Bacteroidales bacterium]|nr:DUF1232 domain-containing protein [Candidatus Sodaliphilus aphodohippi]
MEKDKKKLVDLEKYRAFFDESKLWAKIKKVARKAGIKVVYAALVLYYLSRSNEVPMSAKLKIYGALGYFILPTDAIPDVVVALGYTDDLAALAWALYSMAKYITPEIKQQAEEKLQQWFGKFDPAEIAGLLPPNFYDDEK